MLLKKIVYKLSLLLIGLLGLYGCSSTSDSANSHDLKMPQADAYFQTQATKYDIPSIDSLTLLAPEQEKALLAFVARKDIAPLPDRIKASQFINQSIMNFNYEGLNYSASDAWLTQSGNCMSLAMMTYAVAKYLKVETVFQVVHSAPLITEISNDLMVSSDHVRTFLYDVDAVNKSTKPITSLYFYNGDFSVIDYFPSRNDRNGAMVSDNEFLAMFYRNLAADALIAQKLELSYALIEKGLSLAPDYVPLINMMAVVHRRIEAYEIAEEYYQYGLQFKPNSLSLLSNYSYALSFQGREQESQLIGQQLLELENETPYGWYTMGTEALAMKDYRVAEIYFKKFIKNTPYFHQAYYELAKALSAQGKTLNAKLTLKEALSLTSIDGNQQKYLAKLDWLKHGKVGQKGNE